LKRKTAILCSGRGSNMAALIQAAAEPDYPAEIALVVANKADAPALEIARGFGVRALAVESRPFGRDREAHERAIDVVLADSGIELVCLAGYMRLLTPFFVEGWRGNMLNIHPSLLPAFPGLDTHARALAAGAKLHGCTVHLVTETMDDGPILAQAAVPVLPGDSEAVLAARVLAQEHILYPAALAGFIRDAVVWAGAGAALLNPLP
jgi:formyltetrahydrofolate-dependent phosphoribosylglycinamide formyltransferase